MPNINPNSDRNYIDRLDIENERNFPKFLKGIKFAPFRHITELEIDFTHPITVLTGNNRIGKSTILIAISCSHFKFNKRNPSNGNFERFTWGSIMRFTQYDKQLIDWTYWIKYKQGQRDIEKRGQRKALTKKWNGVAKKESQIHDRQVIFVDLDRIAPVRNSTFRLFQLARQAELSEISQHKKEKVFSYISYILEERFEVKKIVQFIDKDVFQYINSNEYSSYNSASGEDVLTRLLIDIVEADRNSLILIDEIEIGLHPKIQRRLVDIIYHVARHEHKQFIITSHSPTIIGSFNEKSRVFLERNQNGYIKSIPHISVNAAFTKMDSRSYPLVNLYCEDDVSKKIIKKAIYEIQSSKGILNFGELINIIESGSSSDTYMNFKVDKRTFSNKKIRSGYACILDGDMRSETNSSGDLNYPPDDQLFFLFGDASPESYLLETYLNNKPNPTLEYHIQETNAHALFDKMVECSIAIDKNNAFDVCWQEFVSTPNCLILYEELKEFLINSCMKFSPTL
jgi:predicted ATPase